MSLVSAHWFDLLVVVTLIVGFKIGQRKETLQQLISICHWALTLVICLFLYKLPAIWLAKTLSMQPDFLALIIFPIEFAIVYFLLNSKRRRIAKSVVEKEPFGHWEHHTTKVAGALRFFTFLFVLMAWISGKSVTEKDISDYKAFCENNFAGIMFPVPATIHHDIFNGSFTGKVAKEYLNGLLMTAIPRVQYAEKPVAPAVTRTVKLKELDNNFEKESDPIDAKEKSKEPTAKTAETSQTSSGSASRKQVYHGLTLRGISGSGDKLFALINDETFKAGDVNSIRIEDGKVTLHCDQILKSSARVRVGDKPETIVLELGVVTDLEGKPIVKK